jgi:hypothetical protein
MLVSGASVELGAIVQCTLELPQEINGKTELTLDAQSLWCHSEEGSTSYKIGLQLLDISAEDREVIKLMMREFVVAS